MKTNKLILIEQLVRKLQKYNGRTSFAEEEIKDIMGCTSLLEKLDPKREYVEIGDIDFGIKNAGNVIPFRKAKKL